MSMVSQRETERFAVYIPDARYQYQVSIRGQRNSKAKFKAGRRPKRESSNTTKKSEEYLPIKVFRINNLYFEKTKPEQIRFLPVRPEFQIFFKRFK